MTEHRPEQRTPEEERAREAVRSLAPARADAAFRERLKRDFVAGRVGGRSVVALPGAWHRRGIGRLALVSAAAALLVVTVWLTDRGPGWSVLAVSGEGVAMVEGSPVPLTDRDELARRMRPGTRLAVPAGAEIELASAAGLVVQVTAGTEFTLPATPGRWLNRTITAAVGRGEIRVTTGAAFHGARLFVETPEAVVEVTGTTLAVICEPAGTCVCVFDGAVGMGLRGGTMEMVPTGRRRFVFSDGRPPETDAIRPMENAKLGMFRDSRREWFKGVAP